MNDAAALRAGWAFGAYAPGAYHFEHIPVDQANDRQALADGYQIVETINWTIADEAGPRQVHANRYFAANLAEAIGLAARIAIASQEVAETVVAIRPATEAEVEAYIAAEDYFADLLPEAIPDDFAAPSEP